MERFLPSAGVPATGGGRWLNGGAGANWDLDGAGWLDGGVERAGLDDGGLGDRADGGRDGDDDSDDLVGAGGQRGGVDGASGPWDGSVDNWGVAGLASRAVSHLRDG